MTDENPAAQVDTRAATPAQAPDGQAQAPADAGQQPWLNKQEAIDYFKRTRELEATVRELRESAEPKAIEPADDKPGDPNEKVAALQARIDFRDAIQDAGLSLSRGQRDLLEVAYKAQRPRDLSGWIKQQAALFGNTATSAAEAPPPVPVPDQAAPVSNQGAPVTQSGALPEDPRLIPPHVWKGMKRQDRTEHINRYMKSQGMNGQAFKKDA